MNEITTTGSFDLSPRNLEEALQFAEYLADSDLVPKDFKGKPGNVLVAMQWGSEIGMKPLQSLQNIAVINGRPAIWGDAVLALVLSSPVCEYIHEWEENGTAFCKVKRRGKPEDIQSFGEKEAKQAGLIGKQGPWSQYPQRMKKMRARAFTLRDNFADVLKGIPIAEEVGDFQNIERDITPVKQSPAQIAQQAADKARPEANERHAEIVQKLEAVAREYGSDALADEWKKLTKEDRKAIGPEELNRLKNLAATDVQANEPKQSEPEQQSQDEQSNREPGSDDE